MKVTVDYRLCCGSAMCTSIAPDYFLLDGGGKLQLLKVNIRPEDAESIDEAVNCCPTEAITVEEDN
jgi:ferredoxin